MPLFPKLLSGATVQFPLERTYSTISFTNLQEDGSRFRAPTLDPGRVEWKLSYAHLTRVEADALIEFFQASKGRLGTFTFLDPLGNLLTWSADLSKPVWQKTPLLSTTPLDQTNPSAYRLSSTAAGQFRISQTLACPAEAVVCFSLYARADQETSFALSISGNANNEQSFVADANWRQFFVAQAGSEKGQTQAVALSVEANGVLEVMSLSVSAQLSPSAYYETRERSGIFANTRFDQDALSMISDGIDNFSCELRLISRLA